MGGEILKFELISFYVWRLGVIIENTQFYYVNTLSPYYLCLSYYKYKYVCLFSISKNSLVSCSSLYFTAFICHIPSETHMLCLVIVTLIELHQHSIHWDETITGVGGN